LKAGLLCTVFRPQNRDRMLLDGPAGMVSWSAEHVAAWPGGDFQNRMSAEGVCAGPDHVVSYKEQAMKAGWVCGVAVGLLYGSMALAVKEVVLFDNLGDGLQYDVHEGRTLYNTRAQFSSGPWIRTYDAVSFVPDGTMQFARVELPLSLEAGYNEVSIMIFSDDQGLPAGSVETIHLSDKMPPADGYVYPLMVATSTTRPELVAGRRYWVVVAPGTGQIYSQVRWHYNVSGTTQPSAYTYTRDGTWFPWTAQSYACGMRVVGSFSGCARPRSDLDGDCKVGLGDLAILAEDWLKCGYENPEDCL